MAIPRVFVSSTYYDLRHIRKGIELFIDDLGYDSILFESGDIPFSHEAPLDESCYKEIGASHILVLIIGGRFGSPTSDSVTKNEVVDLDRQYQHYNSITQREFETALSEDIPVYIFVERGVAAEYLTYKENRDNSSIRYAHVDSVNIFRLLDFIYSRERNNLTKDFENLEDITSWLRVQWAGLFGDFLGKRSKERTLQTLQFQLNNLKHVTETLKDYSENIIRGISPNKAEEIIRDSMSKQHEKEAREVFSSHHIVRHLVDGHSANLELVMNAFRDSKDINELRRGIDDAMPKDQSCGMIHHMMMDSDGFHDINALRTVLGKPPFDSSDVDLRQTPKRRLGRQQLRTKKDDEEA
jgi:hypothetical protein